MVIEALKTKKISIDGGNIDPRYFTDNGDGTYSVTPTFIYNVARDAEKFYKEQIYSLDTDDVYHTEPTKLTEDTWSDKKRKDELEAKYGDKIKELERRKREWREANPDKCSTRAGGPDLGDIDELRYFSGYSPEIKPSLKEALAIYMAMKQFDKTAGADLKASLPQKPEVLLVKADFRAEYDALIEKWIDELGIDKDLYFKTFDKIERTVPTMRKTNEKVMKTIEGDDSTMGPYIEGLIKYLTSTTKVEFNTKRKETIEFIDKDFIYTFNETVKELKAESISPAESKEAIDSIVIYTKLSEGSSPEKIITISRENPTDSYKYVMSIKTDDEELNFRKNISTKADLRKALEITITMIEDVESFKKYVPDFQATIDTL